MSHSTRTSRRDGAPIDDGAAPDKLPHPDEWERVLTLGLGPLRKLRGWSQAELARRSGLHRRTIWLLEQPGLDKPRPSGQTLKALARAFGYVHLSALWTALQGTILTDPGAPLVVGERIRRMVLAFMGYFPYR